jgi:hypothetical protein
MWKCVFLGKTLYFSYSHTHRQSLIFSHGISVSFVALAGLACETREFKSFVDCELIDILNMKLATCEYNAEKETFNIIWSLKNAKRLNRKWKVDWRVSYNFFHIGYCLGVWDSLGYFYGKDFFKISVKNNLWELFYESAKN